LYGAYVGRLLVTLLLSVAFTTLFRPLRLRLWLALLSLALFLGDQSLTAGEWIVGGFETKTIAYPFVFLALAGFLTRRYYLAFASAGAALCFHVLVGLYALFCLGVAIVLSPEWRLEWRKLSSSAWLLPVVGALGFVEILKRLAEVLKEITSHTGVDAAQAWQIYVQFRVPHHLLPSTWPGHLWMLKLALAFVFFLAVYLAVQSKAMRFLSAYALASVALFVAGLGFYAMGKTTLLRFYWFRFPDVMVPFLACVLLAALVSEFLSLSEERQAWLRGVEAKYGTTLATSVAIILLGLYPAARVLLALHTAATSGVKAGEPALHWIAANTHEQAVFLVEPGWKNFYLIARRATFVSFKHVPQSPADILEWYKRIALANGGQAPNQGGFDALQEIGTKFYGLDKTKILEIAKSYKIDYYLGQTQQPLDLGVVYTDADFTLYRLNEPAP